MEKQKGVFVTVNTDAGYSYKYRVGTYAYWIKGTTCMAAEYSKKSTKDCRIKAHTKWK